MTVATIHSPAHAASLAPAVDGDSRVAQFVAALRRTFGVDFSIFESDSGQLLHASCQQPAGDTGFRSELARAVANRAEPAFLGEEDPVLIFALPVVIERNNVIVAVAAFVTRHVDNTENIDDAAKLLGLAPSQARGWINEQEPWSGRQLNAVGQVVIEQHAALQQNARMSAEIEKVSDNLASTYEEISVLYGVTQNLQLSSTEEELACLALQWLTDVIPASGLAINYLPAETDGVSSRRRQPLLLTAGECPLSEAEFAELTSNLQLDAQHGPVVLNRGVTCKPGWKFPRIEQLIVVPLAQADHLCGWLAAFNHVDQAEFGTVEASLMGSVGAILGIHSGNIELYRRQSDFLAQMVRALTSAIDAKDPYTCGHSDRVARVSVRLAQEMGHDVKTLNRLYLGGLLHDIGKIGIDDQVLRKPGRLTQEEFEHIKLHPELGYNILRDVKQLEDVLPIVLHHHESWDGRGYPHGLAGEKIPLLARICAVADAFDAMSSDRPYREGMPDEKVDAIFREGAGKQWDAEVVTAFFSAREDIREIAEEERAEIVLDVQQWM